MHKVSHKPRVYIRAVVLGKSLSCNKALRLPLQISIHNWIIAKVILELLIAVSSDILVV